MVPAAFHYCSCESVGQSLFVFLFCSYGTAQRTEERPYKNANELGEPPDPGSRIQGPGSRDPRLRSVAMRGLFLSFLVLFLRDSTKDRGETL